MKNFLIMLVCVTIGGCMSISPEQFSGPNGRAAYSMKCSGFGRNVNACFKTAGELCPHGYDIVDRSSGTQAMMFRGTLMAAPKEQLAIECK